jgi:hypothetical protein
MLVYVQKPVKQGTESRRFYMAIEIGSRRKLLYAAIAVLYAGSADDWRCFLPNRSSDPYRSYARYKLR